LPQTSLFSICRGPWSCSKEELDEQLRLLGFHMQQGAENQEEEAPTDYYTVYHHILEMPLLGLVATDLHLGKSLSLGEGMLTTHSSIHHILSVLCISMFHFLSFSLLFLFYFCFPQHKMTKKYLCYFSLFASLVF
jgi:hypothetical protein